VKDEMGGLYTNADGSFVSPEARRAFYQRYPLKPEEGGEDAYLNDPDPRTEAELDQLHEEEHYGLPEHDCPRDNFLEDPITRHYGVGGEMLHLIHCGVCEEFERQNQ